MGLCHEGEVVKVNYKENYPCARKQKVDSNSLIVFLLFLQTNNF